ncbi:Eco57I restriction-modification methylase domain-containing protein [Desulfovulcanus sp.]
MNPLEKALRNQLEKVIKEARDIAEQGARAALEQLGVGEARPFEYLFEDQRDLRRKLRIHGRQLGDRRDPETATQSTQRLIEEVAYEHWHRMLFARFLAENDLLMYPDPDDPVPVTLEECEDLAADEGAKNGWELAARFAARMLPQIFRPDSPVFQLELPPEHQQKLERLLDGLPKEVFTASDSLGWVYQFWQARKKDEINKSEVKIGARELPAVTQLFTEPYMVSFLLDNSIGAWWAARCDGGNGRRGERGKGIFETARSEDEIRNACALPGVPLEYLRFIKSKDDVWAPASGAFEGWPESLSQLKVLDPCCGSGHFLVAAFLMLVPMRMELEGLSAKEAVDAVLRDNLHGLDIDKRVVEIAAFALALTAWRYPDAGGYRQLAELNLACSGLSVSVAREEWEKLANGNSKLRVALRLLHEEFGNAPLLGSLLNPDKSIATNLVDWKNLISALQSALQKERTGEEYEAGVVAHGLAKAATLLTGKYHLVITNVPYLARGKQSQTLRDYCEEQYNEAKNDLATVFLDRCLEFCIQGGVSSIVLPQNWLFLTSYKKFREKLLKNDTWRLIARLGPGAFETISSEVVKAILLTISRGNTSKGNFQPLFEKTQDGSPIICGLDVSSPRTAKEKAELLRIAEIKQVEQEKQLENPDARVALEEVRGELLEDYAFSYKGITTGDDPKFRRTFWDFATIPSSFKFFQSTISNCSDFGGCESVVWFEAMTNPIQPGVYIRAREAMDKKGVMISQMRQLPVARYLGKPFDTNAGAVIPKESSHLPAIWCFCFSPDYNEAVRQIDQSLKVTNATLVKVPFDLEYWTKVAQEKYPNGLPKPYSNDPTQWIFHGHPCGSVIWDEEKKWTVHGPLRTDATVLQVAVARLLGYRWPAELDDKMELAEEQREWVKSCEELLPYADEDGIVCIPAVRGEPCAADRLLDILVAAYGNEWSTDKLSELLKASNHAGKTLETWLRDKFFSQHCKLFHHRPFIWHIWDGLRDGFSVLVNYHKLDRKNLETLIYTYLGDWIARQKSDIENGVDGAEEKLAAAESLKKKLELILEGEAPYDIFVRWKPIEKQPIGWEPDLNDGVRLNIRPFMTVGDVKKKGAGILRDKPNIKWNKDRGKDVESAPWYHLFKGDRINDHHLTLAEKRAAREKMKKDE